jgi:hypothetical protein
VETMMDNYINLTNQPHTLIIKTKDTQSLILKKTFDTEHLAFKYMHEARAYKNNANKFSFTITGPNTYYYQA